MTNDPWADEPVVQAPPTTTQAPAPAKSAAVREQGPSNEGVTVTLKGGTEFLRPWIVIHAADPASALAQLNSPDLRNLIDRTVAVGGYFVDKGAKTPAAGPSGPAPSAPTGAAKPAYQRGPGIAPSCDHGEMVYKSGTNAQGKVWSGHFCPERDKSQQCDPQWTPKGR